LQAVNALISLLITDFMKNYQKLMKVYLPSLSVVVLAGALQTLSAAELTGKVKLKGEPKPEAPIPLESTTCGPIVHTPITTRHYVVAPDKGLANVFVYIKKGAPPTPPAGEAPVLDQVDCQYQPYVLGAVAGQKITIRNSDPLMHNIHATPKNNKEFNFAQVIKGAENKDKSFDKPEVMVRIKCDVHPWMFAYIGVQDHPYFAVTGKDGSFKIPNLPAGTYTIEAYHVKIGANGAKQQEITVTAGDKKTVDFELEVPPPAP
jgi:plastocyanin